MSNIHHSSSMFFGKRKIKQSRRTWITHTKGEKSKHRSTALRRILVRWQASINKRSEEQQEVPHAYVSLRPDLCHIPPTSNQVIPFIEWVQFSRWTKVYHWAFKQRAGDRERTIYIKQPKKSANRSFNHIEEEKWNSGKSVHVITNKWITFYI